MAQDFFVDEFQTNIMWKKCQGQTNCCKQKQLQPLPSMIEVGVVVYNL
jgi:hypothetical protein